MAHILVVDGDQDVRTLLLRILQTAGHQVWDADDGAEGLRLARRRNPELVFCDLFMPGTDGIQTIREFRREFPRIPVVAMSGGSFSGTLDMLPIARALGATQVLPKPFGQQDLLEVADQVLADHLPSAAGA
jgi:CheY-like chemotaxis protein